MACQLPFLKARVVVDISHSIKGCAKNDHGGLNERFGTCPASG